MRGERVTVTASEPASGGSSPHARGTRGITLSTPQFLRIIPACAGNAELFAGQGFSEADHPRMRGERSITKCSMTVLSGSSPHARGTPYRLHLRRELRRIIPACAGNARKRWRHSSWTPDHPRMRGERRVDGVDHLATAGSSPHARGTRRDHHEPAREGRIIPACAGNATCGIWKRGRKSDHPRMRGERSLTTICLPVFGGSSPHARGTRDRDRDAAGQRRIIPACAGNASLGRQSRARRADHPRMRGERGEAEDEAVAGGGSSPHARGTHFLVN